MFGNNVFGNGVRAVLGSAAFQVSAWVGAVVLVVWLLVHYSDRIAEAWRQWLHALDQRAVRQAALKAKTKADREYYLDVLKTLQQSAAEEPPTKDVKPPRRKSLPKKPPAEQ